MNGALSPQMPVGAAFWQGLCHIMDIVMHLGAHRTGTSTFQTYLQERNDAFDAAGVAIWGPKVTRHGMFDGLIPNPMNRAWRKNMQHRAEGRIKINLAKQAEQGHQTLIVSDENMLGSMIGSLREGELYPAAGERMARFVRAFEGRVSRVVLVVRTLDQYWASAMSCAIKRGHSVLSARRINDLATARRGWRDVVMDVACAMPGTKIEIMPFECHAADPNVLASVLLDAELPKGARMDVLPWENRTPDVQRLRNILIDRDQDPNQLPDAEGVWQPFTHAQKTALQEAYADDLFWLVQGADGLATLTENAIPAFGLGAEDARGHNHDQKGRLGGAG